LNQFFSNKKLIILLVSMIVSLGLIAFSITGSGNIPIIQQLTNDITAVVSRVVAKPTNAVVDFLESVDGLKNTYEENQLLKSKIDKLYETEMEIADLKQNNQKLKEQLSLIDTLSDYESINGAVLSRNPDSWVDKIVVDKGSQNGIELDMSVMSGNGLIGRVVEVNPTSSKIQLVTTLDQNNNRVAASVDTDDGVIHGIVNGYDAETNRLIMKQVTTEAELKEGDKVMTSGLGGISPSALLIGTIDEVKLDSFGLSQEAYIIPAADTNDIRYVTFIKRTAESGE